MFGRLGSSDWPPTIRAVLRKMSEKGNSGDLEERKTFLGNLQLPSLKKPELHSRKFQANALMY